MMQTKFNGFLFNGFSDLNKINSPARIRRIPRRQIPKPILLLCSKFVKILLNKLYALD